MNIWPFKKLDSAIELENKIKKAFQGLNVELSFTRDAKSVIIETPFKTCVYFYETQEIVNLDYKTSDSYVVYCGYEICDITAFVFS